MIELDRVHKMLIALLVLVFIVDKAGVFLDPQYDADIFLSTAGEQTIDAGNRFVQISIVATVVLIALYFRRHGSFRNLALHPIMIVYSGFVLCSLLYSIDIGLTIRRILLWLSILYIGANIIEESLTSVKKVLLLFYYFGLVYTFIAALALLRSIIQLHPFFHYPFTVFDASHRDAEVLVITLLLHWYVTKERIIDLSSSFRLLVWGLLPLLIILSLSRTSLGGLVIAAIYIAAARAQNFRYRLMQISVVVAIVFTFFIVLSDEALQGIVRPENVETLMGRTFLWEYLLATSTANYLIGTGYGAFWSSSTIYDVQSSQGWAAPVSHNGFLDVYLNTGLIGVVLTLAILLLFWRKATHLPQSEKVITRGLLVFIIVQNLTQGSFQNPRMYVEIVFWWVFMAVLAATRSALTSKKQEETKKISQIGTLSYAQ